MRQRPGNTRPALSEAERKLRTPAIHPALLTHPITRKKYCMPILDTQSGSTSYPKLKVISCLMIFLNFNCAPSIYMRISGKKFSIDVGQHRHYT